MVTLADANPFGNVQMGSIGLGLLIFMGSVLIVCLMGVAIYLWINKRKLKYTIPLYRMVGGSAMKMTTCKARDFAIGFAGDKLWYVPMFKKYIGAGTIQSGVNEYIHFQREDGEWINVGLGDIDKLMKTAGVKYIQSDMRSQRIAIGNILEQRFKGKKSFWDQYGNMIVQAIFYMIVSICMVIIFYQWGGIIDRTNSLLDKIIAYDKTYHAETIGVVPAFIGLIFRRKA